MINIRFAAWIENSSVLGAFALESTLYSTETASMLSSSTAKASGPGQASLSMYLLLHHSTDSWSKSNCIRHAMIPFSVSCTACISEVQDHSAGPL